MPGPKPCLTAYVQAHPAPDKKSTRVSPIEDCESRPRRGRTRQRPPRRTMTQPSTLIGLTRVPCLGLGRSAQRSEHTWPTFLPSPAPGRHARRHGEPSPTSKTDAHTAAPHRLAPDGVLLTQSSAAPLDRLASRSGAARGARGGSVSPCLCAAPRRRPAPQPWPRRAKRCCLRAPLGDLVLASGRLEHNPRAPDRLARGRTPLLAQLWANAPASPRRLREWGGEREEETKRCFDQRQRPARVETREKHSYGMARPTHRLLVRAAPQTEGRQLRLVKHLGPTLLRGELGGVKGIWKSEGQRSWTSHNGGSRPSPEGRPADLPGHVPRRDHHHPQPASPPLALTATPPSPSGRPPPRSAASAARSAACSWASCSRPSTQFRFLRVRKGSS
ncbi:unnamed protein product, partial [Prorocentrum cordatum]